MSACRSVRDLAQSIDRHESTVRYAELGKAASLLLIGQIARELGVEPAEIIIGEPADDPAQPNPADQIAS